MKKGDVVRIKKSGQVGMITWKKNNQEIGVDVGHYHIVKATKGTCKLENLVGLGCDVVLTKDELEVVH